MTVQELYARIGGDYERAVGIMRSDRLIARYVGKFCDSDVAERLRDAGERMDSGAIFEAAHAMKGVCGNLGLTRIAEAADALTEEFRPGRARRLTNAEVREQLDQLDALCRGAVEGIRAFERKNS